MPFSSITTSKKPSEYMFSDPDRLGGEPVFRGTRVPVRSLFVHIRSGISLEEFLEDFEGVTREQVDSVLELAEAGLLKQVSRP